MSDHDDEHGNKAPLPLARIKRLMTRDSDVKRVTQEAVAVTGKATELFLEYLLDKVIERVDAGNRKTVQYKDVAAIVKEETALMFLRDVIPETKAVMPK
eukprot:GFYU01008820.1.p2 GENE.GFYU01008820.1~~GFYU01008820.1.p2  ORF type:complete len:113 (-),score=36.57 GFYU01008820.1:272-568(-)